MSILVFLKDMDHRTDLNTLSEHTIGQNHFRNRLRHSQNQSTSGASIATLASNDILKILHIDPKSHNNLSLSQNLFT